VDGELRRAVNLEIGEQLLDEADQPEVLHDYRVDAAVHRFAEQHECVDELAGFDQDVEREIQASTARMRDATCLTEFVEGQMGAFVAGVEPRGAQVDRVRAIGHGCAHGVERARRGEELGDATVCHKR
jgi:hypothetical protein